MEEKKIAGCSNGKSITKDLLKNSTKMSMQKSESMEHFLSRVTHLYLNDKKIARIHNLQDCKNAKVLYLYDNLIQEIENLEGTSLLTHLYLTNNLISEIKGVQHLNQLCKLYLDGNKISRLEGLTGCRNLEELHLSNQKIQENDVFSFDISSLQAISGTLKHLKLSACHIESPQALIYLYQLEELDLSKNKILHLEDVYALLKELRSLKNLNLLGNPVCKETKYREKCIVYSLKCLETLDEKSIDTKQRLMMQSHAAHKHRVVQPAVMEANNKERTKTDGNILGICGSTLRIDKQRY